MQHFNNIWIVAIAFLVASSALDAQTTTADKKETPAVDPNLQYHRVPNGQADMAAKLFRELFEGTPIRIEAVPPDKIAVWGNAQTHLEIHTLIGMRPPGFEAAVIQMKTIRATTMVLILKAKFGKPKETAPFIEADTERNAIRVRGTKEQVHEVREEIGRIEKLAASAKGDKNPPEVRFHDVPQGKAEMVAKTLQAIFPNAKIQAINPTRLFVIADSQTHSDVNAVIGVITPPLLLVTEVMRVRSLDAQSLADMFDDLDWRPRTSGVSIVVNKERNGLIARGTADEAKEVKQLIRIFEAFAETPHTRIIRIGPPEKK